MTKKAFLKPLTPIQKDFLILKKFVTVFLFWTEDAGFLRAS
jgi:hypothetical protein